MTDFVGREVVIRDYDPAWPVLYEGERKHLMRIAGEAIIDVLHVGSTSVPGLAAKPIVDLAAVLRRFLAESEIEAVCSLGYEYRGIEDDIQRQYFSRRQKPQFHLHAYVEGNADLRRLIDFRDYLRSHPEAARAYGELKRDLAGRFRFDRRGYEEAKTEFIRAVDAKAAGLK